MKTDLELKGIVYDASNEIARLQQIIKACNDELARRKEVKIEPKVETPAEPKTE